VLALSTELERERIALRPIEPGDGAFLRALFAACRPDGALLALWPASERDAFLDMQFKFQGLHYRRFYPGADFLLVERVGEPLGRLLLDRQTDPWCVVDIGLMPATRGAGIGTALLRCVQDAASRAKASVSLQVEIGNRARLLYERLGFVTTDETGTHIAMRWPGIS